MLRNPVVFSTMLISFSYLLPSCAAPQPKAIKKTANKSQVTASVAVRKPVPVKPYINPYIAWTVDSWTGDDKPYLEARTQIDRAILLGQNPSALLQSEEAKAKTNLNDSLAVFRWGYSACKVTFTQAKLVDNMELMSHVEPYLRTAPSPHTYNYSRLLFLGINYGSQDYDAKPLGERLLQRDPQDDDVKYQMIACLLGYNKRTKADEAQAIALGQSLLKNHPKSLGVHAQIANTYMAIWSSSYKQADANRAIAEYRVYQSLLAPSDPDRKYIAVTIKHIQDMQAIGLLHRPHAG